MFYFFENWSFSNLKVRRIAMLVTWVGVTLVTWVSRGFESFIVDLADVFFRIRKKLVVLKSVAVSG